MLVLYLSMLSVRSKNIYVFGSWQGQKFSDNSKYLFLQAIKDKRIRAIWITRSKEIFKYMQAKGYPVYLHNSVQGIYYQLRAAYYFTSERKGDVSALLLGNATRINLWHGVGLKKILHDIQPGYSANLHGGNKNRYKQLFRTYPYRKEFVLSTSDTMTNIFSSAFKKPKEKILQLGQPRNDVFFNSDLETESLPFIQQGQKMILYMPTHRQGGKAKMRLSDIFDLAMLQQTCESNRVIFVVKKHFFHRKETENLSAFKNIVDITNDEYDTQLLLKHASILITDYSSCYVDYLLLNKPVIFYNYDLESYMLNDRDLYFDYDKTTPGPKVKDFSSLLTCVKDYLENGKDHYESERKRVKEIFYATENQSVVGGKILSYVKERLN